MRFGEAFEFGYLKGALPNPSLCRLVESIAYNTTNSPNHNCPQLVKLQNASHK